MSKNSKPKILLEKIVEYEPKYFNTEIWNQNVANVPRETLYYFCNKTLHVSNKYAFFFCDFLKQMKTKLFQKVGFVSKYTDKKNE